MYLLSNFIIEFGAFLYGSAFREVVNVKGITCLGHDTLGNINERIATISDAMYMHNNTIAEREWLSYGALFSHGGVATGGVSCLNDYGWPGYFLYDLATIIYRDAYYSGASAMNSQLNLYGIYEGHWNNYLSHGINCVVTMWTAFALNYHIATKIYGGLI